MNKVASLFSTFYGSSLIFRQSILEQNPKLTLLRNFAMNSKSTQCEISGLLTDNLGLENKVSIFTNSFDSPTRNVTVATFSGTCSMTRTVKKLASAYLSSQEYRGYYF